MKTQPSLIAKSFGCGTIGGLAAAQIATQVALAMALATFATPAGWIGGTGTAIFYYNRDKQNQTDNIFLKAIANIEKVEN